MGDEDPLAEACRQRVGTMPSGKWRLDALIGVGGMAAVYAATHRNGNHAALKILHPEFAGNAEVRARFLREAYIANKLDHPGTVRVLDDDVSETGEPYLVMELLVGESVESRARRNGGWLKYAEVLDIVDQTLAVLEKAHSLGVVHRDLKPDNLFRTSKGEIKVLDFGIARLHDVASAKRTQTGMMMGTPAYMAPEQALGKWGEVDARSDLWSMGAIIFSLLTGRSVHEGATDNEVFIRAATRPAPSLGRVLPKAPIELVRVVDRALAFEPSQRFSDAREMRVAIRELMRARQEGGAGAGTATGTGTGTGVEQGRGNEAPERASMRPDRASAAPRARLSERARRGEAYDAAYASDDDLSQMAELFVETERALTARAHYGDAHPETKRRFEKAFHVCAAALERAEFGLVWNVSPYSFVAREKTLWEPSSPLDRLPYQLFADGVRTLGFVHGLEETEFRDFFRLLMLDRASEVAPEDDFVTLLWDAGYEHIVHQAIDTYSEGDQTERVRFENDRADVVDFARADSDAELAEAWQRRGGAPPADGLEAKQSRLLGLLAGAEELDTEAIARAADFGAGRTRIRSVDPGAALSVDESLRTVLLARLSLETGAVGDRFVVAAARAFEEGDARGAGAGVTVPLRVAVDGLSTREPALSLDLVSRLCEEVGRSLPRELAEARRGKFAGAIVSPKMMEGVLAGARADGADRELYSKGLRSILGYADGSHFGAVLGQVTSVPGPELRQILIDYLARVGKGHEAEIGGLFASADLELGLALVRILTGIDTKAARDAISDASRSPHAVVRIEALGHVEGASSERLRLELRALLEDKEAEVRLAALRAMEQHGIRVAGPFLALRVRSPGFDALSPEERRQAFVTLVALAPSRAESAALEVANDRRLVSTDAHEVSREIATELLGRIGVSPEALAALDELKGARLRNSDRVRAAAARAYAEFTRRAAKRPPASPSRPPGRSSS